MKRIVSVILATVFTLGLGVATYAQNGTTRTPRINRRERNQQNRIYQGVRSGQLTRREAGRLERQESVTRRQEHRAKADGVVTPQERAHLLRRENRTSRHIYNQKHDGQVHP